MNWGLIGREGEREREIWFLVCRRGRGVKLFKGMWYGRGLWVWRREG